MDLIGGLWAAGKQPKPDIPDPNLSRLLSLLRSGPQHPDTLRKTFPDCDGLIRKLRERKHRIKSILFCGQAQWVCCIVENGRLCGVEGEKGDYPYSDEIIMYGQEDTAGDA